MKLGFFYRNRSCFPWSTRKRLIESLFLSALDYGDIIYRNASATTLKTLDPVYHSALRFITGDNYNTHHCILYNKVGWPSLATRRDQHWFVFIYKGLIERLPPYLNSLLVWKKTNGHHTRSQDYLMLEPYYASTEFGKSAFKCGATNSWNTLQASLKYSSLVSLDRFKLDISNMVNLNCTCFNWVYILFSISCTLVLYLLCFSVFVHILLFYCVLLYCCNLGTAEKEGPALSQLPRLK